MDTMGADWQEQLPGNFPAGTAANPILVPDLWQQEAIRRLRAGEDVVVDAPTGAGKTLIFEKFVEQSAPGRCIYTVPTRALANDKLMDWRSRGWNVGIATGDLAENLSAPIVVATLETQRQALLRGEGPDLLVIDEFQMLNDPLRGLHYELAIASAPDDTQLLLFSGSTANPGLITSWLDRLGRTTALIRCKERPVPLEEVNLDSLRHKIPQGVRGHWPRRIAKALAAGLGPILIFAPRRQAAEEIARRLAASLPPCEPLELTAGQSAIARGSFRKLLSRRVAFHHSGLDYRLRAGVIEPLAKHGQLRVVGATTGLAAGIHVSLRSVMVTEANYRFGDELRWIRSDELLQMFGRAGRRGIDTVGFVLSGADKPRLRDGRPVELAPNRRIDWQACLTRLQEASARGDDPRESLSNLNQRFLSGGRLHLGLDEDLPLRFDQTAALGGGKPLRITEMENPDGEWERLGKKRRVALEEALFRSRGSWCPALSSPEVLDTVHHGSMCRLPEYNPTRYGRLLTLAVFPEEKHKKNLDLTKRFRKMLLDDWKTHRDYPQPKSHCPLDLLESRYLPLLPRLTGGGEAVRWDEKDGAVRVYLDYGKALAFCRMDQAGRALINPVVRERTETDTPDLTAALGNRIDDKPRRPARNWFDLGLIDSRFRPTRRGMVFSFFSQGEGLAIAAGLEDHSFAVEEMIFQLANLRAGHRFEEMGNSDGRLGDLSRLLYGWRTIPGYLKRGVPTEYGEGAAEVVAALVSGQRPADLESGLVRPGDIERALLEWRSILRQIVHAPDFAWDRWLALRQEAWKYIDRLPSTTNLDSLPSLATHQRVRLEYG